MKLEQLDTMYRSDGDGYFSFQITLSTSGENDFGSNGFGRNKLNHFLENICPKAQLEFIVGSTNDEDNFEIVYGNREIKIQARESTKNLLGAMVYSSPGKLNIFPNMFEPANPHDKTYPIYIECEKNIQEYVGSNIPENYSSEL